MTDLGWLERNGWKPAGNGDFSFGDEAAEAAAALSGTVLSPLAHLGAIRASGADAESFLQNQLSNDVRQLAPDRVQLSSYNSPKGRVLDLFALRRDGEAILLETRRDTLPASLKRLRMFVLRSKTVLEEVGESLFALGAAGADAAALLQQAGLPLPAQDWQQIHGADGLVVMRRPGARYSLHGPAPRLEALWPRLAAQARPVGTAAWRLLDVLAGLPAIRPETADHFVAQMLNLDQLGAISFTKGCYPGQEIVARMHYLGNLKRRMFLCRSEAVAALPGTDVFAGGSESAAGEVVHAAPHPDGGVALLAVLQLAQAEAPLRLGSGEGAALKVVAALAQAEK
ncbi:MAG TPA: hypothetical protein VFA75_06825 [Nevskia sp.]|nr:hypothetical protein [Nevskia sp.]